MKSGLASLHGSSPSVGAIGYTAGGGIPLLAREYGFAADHVRAVELVTADGRLRRLTEDEDPDLFWAVRGGKGNFGVITAMEIGLVPRNRLYGGGLFFPGERAAEVLSSWREWSLTVPENMSTSLALLRLPPLPEVPEPLRQGLAIHVRIAYTGSAGEGEKLVAPLRSLGARVLDTVAEMPYAAVPSIHMDPPEPIPHYTGAGCSTSSPTTRSTSWWPWPDRTRLPGTAGRGATVGRRRRPAARSTQRGRKPRGGLQPVRGRATAARHPSGHEGLLRHSGLRTCAGAETAEQC